MDFDTLTSFLYAYPMSKFTAEILMIEIRKTEALKRPRLGEILQGIFFALYNAKNNFEAATLLFEKHPTSAFGLYISAMEEIGKVSKLSNAFIEWQSPEKLNEFHIMRKNHPWKLASALSIFQSLLEKKDAISIKTNPTNVEIEKKFFTLLAEHFDPQAAKSFHNLRMNTMYTDFDKNIAQSPNHFLEQVSPERLKIITPIFSKLLEGLINICNKILPDYFKLIDEVYFCRDAEKVKILKTEINRQSDRMMPALRKVCCENAMKTSDIHGDDWFEKYMDNPTKTNFNELDMTVDFPKIRDLISGPHAIELIYFYPPLKDSAKNYYSNLQK